MITKITKPLIPDVDTASNVFTSAIYHIFGFNPVVLKSGDVRIKVNVIGTLDLLSEAVILLEGQYIGTCKELMRELAFGAMEHIELTPSPILLKTKPYISTPIENIIASTEFMGGVTNYCIDNGIPIPRFSEDVLKIATVSLNTNHRM